MESGRLRRGDRLPPTRELAPKLGLNRTTVSAAYDVLENEGLIKGEVGRGSYVSGVPGRCGDAELVAGADGLGFHGRRNALARRINFSSSRPSEKLFPWRNSGNRAARFWRAGT